MELKDPFLFLLAEGDGFPSNLGQFMMLVDINAEDLRVLCSTDVLLPLAVGYTCKSWTSANVADHVNLKICVLNQRLWWPGNVLI